MSLLSNLYYSGNVPQYVAPPIGTLREVMEYKENQYISNRDSADKLEIAISNLDLNDKDAGIKEEAIESTRQQFKEVVNRGDWENASLVVKQAAKDFATNSAMQMALKSRAEEKQQKAVLQEMVKSGDITQDDYEYVVNEANANYQGVQKDPNTGKWTGSWSARTPPKYIDIGKYTDDFLNEFKPDQYFGEFVKKEDGWYRVTRTRTTPGGHEIGITTEKADYNELYNAAKSHVLQNNQIRSRVNFEMSKDKRSMEDYVAEQKSTPEDVRKAMINDLTEIAGYDQKSVAPLTDSELITLHKQESLIHQAISGAVSKHAYVKEEIQNFGLTLDAQMQRDAAKARAEKSASQKEAEMNRVLLQNKGITLTNPFQHPDNYAGIQQVVSAGKKNIENYTKDINDLSKQLEDFKANQIRQGKTQAEIDIMPEYENLTRRIEMLKFDRNTEQFMIENSEKEAEDALQRLMQRGEVTKEEYNKFKNFNANLTPQTIQLINKVHTQTLNYFKNKFANASGIFAPSEETKQKVLNTLNLQAFTLPEDDKQRLALNTYINEAVANGYIKPVDAALLDKHMNNSGVELANINKKLNKELKERTQSIAVETAYVNIGLGYGDSRGEWSNASRFALQVSNDFMGNKNGWVIVDKDGKRLYDDKPSDKRNNNVTDIKILGMTTESVGKYGYMVAANITTGEGDDKKEEFVYISPLGGYSSNIMELAKMELLEGNPKLIGTELPGAAKTNTDLARKYDKYLLDTHMSQFNDHTITPNQTVTKKIPLAYDGMYAEVSRVTGSSVGNLEYRTVVKNENGTVNIESMGGKPYLVHRDKFVLEGDLEHFQGVMFDKRLEGMRTTRHNNPAAFTVDVAKTAGLVEGVDYTVGDSFTGDSGKEYKTAKLIGDPIETTIRVIDKIGFFTGSGKPRWSYMTDPDLDERWKKMSKSEKIAFIRKMNEIENGLPGMSG